MNNQLDVVLRKLSSEEKKIYDFYKRELYAYIDYRIKNLLWRNIPVCFNELRYNLCEVGPGNRRIDPLLLMVILNSDVFRTRYSIGQQDKSDGVYYYHTEKPVNEEGQSKKSRIISRVIQMKKSPELYEKIQYLFTKTVEKVCTVNNVSINIAEEYIEFKLTYKDEEKEVLLRYYNSSDWLYVNDKRLWDFFEKASRIKAVPVILCPYMHKSCFSLFKKAGIYGRSLYYCFLDKNVEGVVKDTLSEEERKKVLSRRFGLEKIHDINHRVQAGFVDEVLQLLETIKGVHGNALERLRVCHPLVEPIKEELLGDYGHIENRLASMKKLLKTLKIKENSLLIKMIGFYYKML